MGGNARQPIDLVILKGNKHLTKAEIEERKSNEVHAPDDDISPPKYLNKEQRKEFKKFAKELISLSIMSNLDCDALARFIIAKDNYIKYTELLERLGNAVENLLLIEKAIAIQDKSFKQCRAASADLGLSISSRCKLVVPKPAEPKTNKFIDKFGRGTG